MAQCFICVKNIYLRPWAPQKQHGAALYQRSIAGTEPELKDERVAHPSALSIALGTRFRGRYNKQNIELYGLAQYSACLVALGIKFRGRPTLVKDGGVYTPPSFSHG